MQLHFQEVIEAIVLMKNKITIIRNFPSVLMRTNRKQNGSTPV